VRIDVLLHRPAASILVAFLLVGCGGEGEGDVAAGAAAEPGCGGSTIRDYPSDLPPGDEWIDHFPEEAQAIAFLVQTTAEPPRNMYGPVEPTEMERQITEAQLAAFAELERDDARSNGERAHWVGPDAEVVLGRTANGWRVEEFSSAFPPELCEQARAERAERDRGREQRDGVPPPPMSGRPTE
jgi:hypothetical protein